MKIAFWHFYTLRMLRGIETLTISLANTLVRRGHDVSLITAKGTVEPLVRPDPQVRIHAFPTPRYFEHQAIVPFYAAHLLRHQYDHVLAFFSDFGEGTTLRLLGRMVDVPLSLYLCYPNSAVPHRYRALREFGWDQKARRILAVADWIADEAQQVLGRTVSVMPVGTDPERFRPDPVRRAELRRKWGYTDQHQVLLNVGALEPRKGAWRAIQAMGRLKGRIPNLRYFLLGQGVHEPELRRMVADMGLHDIVTFGGASSESERYFAMGDIFVMLSEGEANSLACQEAMSCGLPVIVSDSGGFVESVPQTAGRIVPPADTDAVDQAILQLAGDASLRTALGMAGRQHVLANYSWDHIADRFLELVA